MQKIVPHLWFDKEAREAADFYVSLFDSSRLVFTKVIKNPPPFGDAEIVGFEICGINFVAISAGPYFKINSSISLTVACTDDEEFSKLRNALIEGGSEVFCENGPTNEKTCTICDRFGVTWVLMSNKGQAFQKITPSFHFSGEVFGKAEEAARYYAEVFSSSEITDMVKNEQGDKVKRAEITLDGFKIFAANIEKGSPFNEAFSFIVTCKDQNEIDYFWERLSFDPDAESCGWCKDKFGVSWQVLPYNWEALIFDGTEERVKKVNAAVLQMKKIDIEVLKNITK